MRVQRKKQRTSDLVEAWTHLTTTTHGKRPGTFTVPAYSTPTPLDIDKLQGAGYHLRCHDLVINGGEMHINMPLALAVPWLRVRATRVPSAAAGNASPGWHVSGDSTVIELLRDHIDASHPAFRLHDNGGCIAGVILARHWESYCAARRFYPGRELRLLASRREQDALGLWARAASRDTRATCCFDTGDARRLPEMWPCDMLPDDPHRRDAAIYHEVVKRDVLATYRLPYRRSLLATSTGATGTMPAQRGHSHSLRRELLALGADVDWLIARGALVAVGPQALYTPVMHSIERDFVHALDELHERQSSISHRDRIQFNSSATCTLNVHQRLAVATFEYNCPRQIMILGGRGGTGKTYVLQHMLSYVPTVYCAPTGQAAGVLARVTRSSSTVAVDTLHRIIMRLRESEPESEQGAHFATTKALVVDEASMVFCELVTHVVCGLLRLGAPLQRVVIVGDRDQLPSVETGGLIDDLMRVDRRLVPYVELKRNMRSNSPLVYHNAQCLKRHCPHAMRFDKSTFRFIGDADDVRQWFLDFFKRHSPDDLRWHVITGRNETADHINNWYGDYAAIRTRRTLIRQSDANLAVPLEERANSRNSRKYKQSFPLGCKLMFTRNWPAAHRNFVNGAVHVVRGYEDHRLVRVTERDSRTNHPIAFEVGDVRRQNRRRTNHGKFMSYADLRMSDTSYVRRVRLQRRGADTDECWDLDTNALEKGFENEAHVAAASTVHKFQGSEAPIVVNYVRPGDQHMLTWRHLYTANTRATETLIVLGSWPSLVRIAYRPWIPRRTGIYRLFARPPPLPPPPPPTTAAAMVGRVDLALLLDRLPHTRSLLTIGAATSPPRTAAPTSASLPPSSTLTPAPPASSVPPTCPSNGSNACAGSSRDHLLPAHRPSSTT